MMLKKEADHTMTSSKTPRAAHRRKSCETIPVHLLLDEVSTLIRLSRYYGRTLGVVRRAIQIGSRGEMRAKANFVQEEAYWLRRFAEAQRDRMESEGLAESIVAFTPRSLVAFYGRTLASLNVPRARRRLSPEKIQAREALAEKLRSALAAVYSSDRAMVEADIHTRRLREQQWINEGLAASIDSNDH
jgi:hypothetical protein